MIINIGDVWFVKFPFEEDNTLYKSRPVIVLDVETFKVLSVKITKHPPRDDFDYELVNAEYANLHVVPSTARLSQTIMIHESQFVHKIGILHIDDLEAVRFKYLKYTNSLI